MRSRIVTGCVAIGMSIATTVLAANTGDGTYRLKEQEARAAHKIQQKAESQAFRQTLKEMTPEARHQAIIQHRTMQYAENKAFNQELHQDNMAYLASKLAANTKLTAAQKDELTAFLENQYQEKVSFRDAQHAAAVAEFERVANDGAMTQEAKKEALKAYFNRQRAAHKAFLAQQKEAMRAEKEKVKAELKAAPAASATAQ